MVDVFFVSLGAIIGANTRFKILNSLGNVNLKKDSCILLINTFASFSLGLFLALSEKLSSFSFSDQLVLFFSVGFLGSFSTFSSFVYDLFELCLQFKFSMALKLFVISFCLGITAFAFGFLLGNK